MQNHVAFSLSPLLPPDLITSPRNQEDEAHNVQAVIDSLALDYLQVSLSHITGWYIFNHQIILHSTNLTCLEP